MKQKMQFWGQELRAGRCTLGHFGATWLKKLELISPSQLITGLAIRAHLLTCCSALGEAARANFTALFSQPSSLKEHSELSQERVGGLRSGLPSAAPPPVSWGLGGGVTWPGSHRKPGLEKRGLLPSCPWALTHSSMSHYGCWTS